MWLIDVVGVFGVLVNDKKQDTATDVSQLEIYGRKVLGNGGRFGNLRISPFLLPVISRMDDKQRYCVVFLKRNRLLTWIEVCSAVKLIDEVIRWNVRTHKRRCHDIATGETEEGRRYVTQ